MPLGSLHIPKNKENIGGTQGELWGIIACVAGGIVGARKNILTAETASPLAMSGSASKTYSARLQYNTASYAG